MSKVLERIRSNAQKHPDSLVYSVFSETAPAAREALTWGELEERSDRLAVYLHESCPQRAPVIVYGHKSPYMLVCFLACVKSGRAYVPVDSSFPAGRINDILRAVSPELMLATEALPEGLAEVKAIQPEEHFTSGGERLVPDPAWEVSAEDNYYIIFTSGSTGKPKGVQITSDCLDHFVQWAVTLGGAVDLMDGSVRTFINQAPFSFDLSVFDLYLALYTGGTLWAIPKQLQGDMDKLYKYLGASGAAVWVSTPSFAELALADSQFREALVPTMKLFLFCGETLTNQTAEKLHRAFPRAEVVNTYGPTESTVAMTSVCVTPELCARYAPLPVGVAKPGTWVYIMDEAGKLLPEGEKGEIVIVGDSVSPGYWRDPEKTAAVFGAMRVNGTEHRLYHTRDKGSIKEGMLFFHGRIDLQIKLHGYRIELEDIESNLLSLRQVERAAVLPDYTEGAVSGLSAFVVLRERSGSALKERQRLREELKQHLPAYMLPRRFIFCDSLPMTANGKVDRRRLEEMSRC